MRGRNSIVVVAVLALCCVAWSVPWTASGQCPSSSIGPGKPVSWYVEWNEPESPEELVIVPEVPGSDGVIITDIILSQWDREYELVQRDGGADETKARLRMYALFDTEKSGPLMHPLGPGIPFCEGSSIVVRILSNEPSGRITIIGRTY